MRFDRLAEMAGGRLITADRAADRFTGVSTDSRTIRDGELFIAVQGERVDGHAYIEQAVEQGAAGVVAQAAYVNAHQIAPTVAVVEVENSHEAMIALAKAYIDTLPARRIGVTGSNGKTTTKEFAYCLLAAVEDNVYRSPGNFNNLFGIPLTVFAMPSDTRVAVLEMGISTPGEMARLADIVRPHSVTITNISATHLEFLGTVEAVALEKLSLLDHSAENAPLIVNADDALLISQASKRRSNFVTYGRTAEADFTVNEVVYGTDGVVTARIEGHTFRMPVFGEYQVSNLLAAYATTRALGYGYDSISTEDIEFTTAPLRGEVAVEDGVTFIVDCYNANPGAVLAGLKSFEKYPATGRRVIILGDMLELGKDAESYHRQVGDALAATTTDLAILVGPLAEHIRDQAVLSGLSSSAVMYFEHARDGAEQIRQILHEGDLVYLKGSRGIALESIFEAWRRKEGSH